MNLDTNLYTKSCNCRACGHRMLQVTNLGSIAIAGAFQNMPSDTPTNRLYPFTLGFCPNCYIILCQEIIEPNILFESGYFYWSSQIPSLVQHFRKYAKDLRIGHSRARKVLEIGCNDGVFLRPLIEEGFDVVGVDPAKNVTAGLIADGIPIYNDYIENCTDTLLKEQGSFDLIVASNCLAHTPNIKEVFTSISRLLKPTGHFYMEVHYGGAVFLENQFDFLYHEHMTYYTISSLIMITTAHKMRLKNVEFTKIHGKSIRVCCDKEILAEVPKAIWDLCEKEKPLRNVELLQEKSEHFHLYKEKLRDTFEQYASQNFIQYAYGASGRANTICTYCDLRFERVVDDAPSKIGRYTPYYDILIENSSCLYEPTSEKKVLWIMAWPYADAILSRHKDFDGIIVIPDFTSLDIKQIQ